MKHQVRLTKVKNNHNRLRDDVIEGRSSRLPTKGKPFELIGEPRDDPNASGRLVTTNVLTEVKREGDTFTVTTASNSIYQIDLIKS